MSTNYYLKKGKCSHCGNDEMLHIGKSSYGWYFSLHVIKEKGINTLDDWLELFSQFKIEDEYSQEISASEMIEIIKERRAADFSKKDWSVYGSEEDFHRLNKSERGVKGMYRTIIDGNHCIGHGDTWSYIVGDFC